MKLNVNDLDDIIDEYTNIDIEKHKTKIKKMKYNK